MAPGADQKTFLAKNDGMEAERITIKKIFTLLFEGLRKVHNNRTLASVAASMASCVQKNDEINLFQYSCGS